VLRNDDLRLDYVSTKKALEAAKTRILVLERDGDLAAAQAERFRSRILAEKLAVLSARIDKLELVAESEGEILTSGLEHAQGRHLDAGDKLMEIASLGRLEILGVLGESDCAEPQALVGREVELRMMTAPAAPFRARIVEVSPRAEDAPPPEPVTDAAGGPIIVDRSDPRHPRSVGRWFSLKLEPAGVGPELRPGTTGWVRFETGRRPLALQWYSRVLSFLRSRFFV
jgi:hypothetical protein